MKAKTYSPYLDKYYMYTAHPGNSIFFKVSPETLKSGSTVVYSLDWSEGFVRRGHSFITSEILDSHLLVELTFEEYNKLINN
jgi:hypothetical protein